MILGAIGLASPAQAQDAPSISSPSGASDVGEAIVVTGSRIVRRDLESASPVTVVGAEEFQLSGAVNVEQVLNTLPQVLPGVTSFSNNPGNGAVTLNLRNLGATRTMVLVNGRRWMFYNTSQIVDLNTIPQFMVEGVDLVTGGASAVYGSDAIAGVANFRLRTDLDGIEAGANYSLTGEGDGARYSFDLAMGTQFSDGRGNVTLYGNYTKRNPIYQAARDFSRFAAGDACIVPGSTNSATGVGTSFGGSLGTCVARGGEVGLIAQGSASTPIATLPNIIGPTNPSGLIFDPTGGGVRPYNPAQDSYNFAPVNYLQLPQERYLVGGYANYEITNSIEAYAEGSFINNSVPQELAATPIGQSVSLQVASPFFDPATQARLAALDAGETICAPAGATCAGPNPTGTLVPAPTANDGYYITNAGFRFVQSGPRNVDANRTAFRVLGGMRGDLTETIRWDAYYSYARTRNAQYQQGNIARSRFAAALNTEFAGGALQCRDASARAAGCVPLNIFGLNQADPAAIQYVTVSSNNVEVSELKNAVASISGSLFDVGMGAGPIGFAVGGEYRETGARYIPDAYLASGDVAGFNAGQPTSGSYDVKELFGELYIPLLRDTFVDRFELTGAARYSDYSLDNVGGVWTYAAGAELSPIPDITLRANYQRAVRAPNVEDLFGGNSTGFPAAIDPCSDRGPATERTDALRQLCIQSGVPANQVFTAGVQPNSQIQANFGGDANLTEETSDTYTFGAVIRPSFIPRLNITVDYFDITVDDAISTFGGGLNSALQLCYTVAQDLTNPICSVFAGMRNSVSGALGETSGGGNVSILSANIARLETSGVDVQVDYSYPLDFSLSGDGSNLSFFFLGTWLDKFRSTAVAAIPERETIGEGSIAGPTPPGTPLPEWRHTARLTYRDGPGTLSLRWRYMDGVEDPRIRNTFVGLTRTGADPALLTTPYIGAMSYFDLTAAVEVNDNVQFTAGVNNILGKQPMVLGSAAEQANTFPGAYDVLGTDFFMSARVTF
jgi:outer membrane receptor protein involved in Fe transport